MVHYHTLAGQEGEGPPSVMWILLVGKGDGDQK